MRLPRTPFRRAFGAGICLLAVLAIASPAPAGWTLWPWGKKKTKERPKHRMEQILSGPNKDKRSTFESKKYYAGAKHTEKKRGFFGGKKKAKKEEFRGKSMTFETKEFTGVREVDRKSSWMADKKSSASGKKSYTAGKKAETKEFSTARSAEEGKKAPVTTNRATEKAGKNVREPEIIQAPGKERDALSIEDVRSMLNKG